MDPASADAPADAPSFVKLILLAILWLAGPMGIAHSEEKLTDPPRAGQTPAAPGSAFGTLTGGSLKQGGPEPAASPVLLNGATSLDETYGDWTVACRLVQAKAQCLLSQSQGDRKTGQQAFALQLRPPQGGASEGTILMPFGLQLDAGAVLKLDGKDLGQGLRFSTCVPQGCLLPVRFPAEATAAIGKASTFTVSSLDLSSGTPVTFNVSTNGFKTALERTAQLSR